MTFFNEYKNNKKLNKKYVENVAKEMEGEYFPSEGPGNYNEDEHFNSANENIQYVKEKIKEEILNEKITANPFFDEQLFNHLDNLHSYISGYIPNYPKYYNNKKEINPKAFLDARDIIKNELPISTDEILNSSTNISGIMNDTKMNFENGFQIDSDGNVYNANKKIIFNPKNPNEKVKFIDLLNKKVVTENGIRINLPDNFINEFIKDNENLSSVFKDKLEYYEEQIIQNSDKKASDTYIIEDIYATVKGVPISYKDKIYVEMYLDDVFIGDMFGDKPNINLIDDVEKYIVDANDIGLCNFKDIPYSELNSKLFWGGGQRGLMPLSSENISDKDISFAPDGTVYYSGSNSTSSIHRPGCKSKSFKTGHVCMWSEGNKTGLKTSMIQYIYKFCNIVGLFNANIPPLIGYKKIKIFPGLCIGGLVEMALLGWQERISKRINEMFQCVPTAMPTDSSSSTFENETFQYGSSVANLEELDNIKSCKFGDRYIINSVDTKISGLKDQACGVFLFDPNNKLSETYKWRYKVWSGKPFNLKTNNTVIKEFENMYDNPLIQDLLMNTNALGEDSITRKLMALQFAYAKKQTLLSVSDVQVSIDSIIKQTVYQILDKLTDRIANYILLLDYKENSEKANSSDNYNHLIPSSGVPIDFANMFLNTYSYLTDNGILKSCPLDKCLREIRKSVSSGGGNSGGTASVITVNYYDFTGYDPNEYLVPSYSNISSADCMAFSAMYIPNEELKEVYNKNLNYLSQIGSSINQLEKVKTIREYINLSEDKAAFEKDIEDNLRYIEYELNYAGYDARAHQQIRNRCSYTINSKIIF